ncbi:Na+/H+ antiporter NhaA [Rhodococcus sp. HNM0569]|uniref:Na+/H+ antiporter NhaA n=1 Tax=Rhodococcus sp. HNM0569 TaxID=2716340 RepID=UPI00146DA71F|nr:Na+/H+ antiporter NhaA [Rhodococcus sp. HNM0569]
MTTRPASRLADRLRTETVGGALLLVAAVVAVVWANSPIADWYTTLRDTHLGPEALHLDLTIGTWAQDGLLAVFFFIAGLELKSELVVGELADRKRAALPVLAALGGVVVPAIIAFSIGHGQPGMDQGWAIPVATDIAFALGVFALAGSRVPPAARVFLLSLAVVDDLLAIAIIAVVFTASVALMWLLAAVALLVVYALAQRRRITTPWLYVPVALATWYCIHEAGIHATIAGVALGLLTRVRRDRGEEAAPAHRLVHRIQPFSAGLCVPLFALFASGVALSGDVVGSLFTSPVSLAVILGLLVGKPVGIFGVTVLATKLGIATMPRGVGYRDMFAVSVLCAIGFTVSLLVTELALTGYGDEAELAKAAVLMTSLAASLIGSALLLRRGRVTQAREQGPDE